MASKNRIANELKVFKALDMLEMRINMTPEERSRAAEHIRKTQEFSPGTAWVEIRGKSFLVPC